MNNKSIKKNGIFNILKTCSSIIFPLITFPYASRTLLSDNVGKVNFGISIVSYFALLASLGVNTYAIRECAAVRNDKNKLGEVAGQILSMNIVTTILAYILLAITLTFYNKLSGYRVLIIIQSFSILATTLGADWLNSAMEDFKYITIRTIIFQIIALSMLFILVHKPEDYMKYAAISVLSSSGASIANIWYRKRYCKIKLTYRINWQKHLKPILYLFVMILAQNIYTNIDSTMLGLMISDREVGLYTTAHKIMNLVVQMIISIVWVVLPRLSLYFSHNDYKAANDLISKIFSFFSLVGLPCICGVALLSEDIILIVAGEDYLASTTVLQILMIGFVFNLFGSSFMGNIILLPEKREKQYMIICCITACFNAITNYFLIPSYGAYAAAFTTGMSNFLMFIIFLIVVDKHVKILNWKKSLFTPIIGCVVIAIICLFCKGISNIWLRTICSVIFSVVCYSAIQYVLKNEMFYVLSNKMLNRIFKKNSNY